MSEEKKTKSKKIRSSAYPAISLEEAVQSIDKIKKQLGKGEYGRESMAKALGYSKDRGDVARKIAALVHYGLMDRDKATYKYNENLSERILNYADEQERKQALIEAVSNPKLFKDLISTYKGQPLPDLLENILARKHGINENTTKRAKNIFINSIEFAGIYVNGVILNDFNAQAIEDGIVEDGENEDVFDDQENQISSIKKISFNNDLLSLELPCGLIIKYPKILAYNFAMGDFSETIKKLNEEIQEKINGKNT